MILYLSICWANFDMKSVSSRKNKSENMPSEEREMKSVFQHQSHKTNQGQERNFDTRTPEVTCRNRELLNSLQILRSKTIGMGHPGHYFQKALNSLTQKTRSQSLPSCLESKKLSGARRDDRSKDVLGPKQLDDSQDMDVITLKVNSIISNETWFRTWPERGNDKLASPHSNTSGCNAERTEFNKEEGCVVCEEKRSGKDNPILKDNTPTSVSDSDSVNKSVSNTPNTHQSCHSVSQDKTFKLDTYALKTNQYIPLQSSALWKSDLSSNCRAEDYNLNTQHNSSVISPGNVPIPLGELLQNIPIAYSPVTRQLHIINSPNIQQQLHQSEKCENFKKVVQNGLKQQLECIEEEGVGDKYKSLARCGEDDCLSFESPYSTLKRFGTSSLLHTDASSFSSIVSSLSDISPSTNDDLDDPTSTVVCNPSESGTCFSEGSGGAKAKRKGISAFFSRNVFVWKSSRDSQNNSSSSTNSNATTAPGWKLFGRLGLKTGEQDAAINVESSLTPESPASIRSTGSGSKYYEDIVASSTALILHDRPSNLPAKSQDEEQKHRQEYQQMVAAARKKELKEAKLRKKQLQRQLKVEEQLANAARIWNSEILPKWDVLKTSRKARDLWWQGIPPSVRGKVWKLAIGNDLNVTHQLYSICLARAQERMNTADSLEIGEAAAATRTGDSVNKEASMELIQLDISRTFPHLCIFQCGGPYYDMLHCLLGAYVCYRPDVGYVQGMSFIAAVLILNLEAADAFVCFANLLNRPCHMAFFSLNQTLMNAYYAAYNDFFRENLPRLYTHFTESSLSADLYLLDWLYTVFAKAMPLDVACRVWDVFLRDGEEFLFKAALGVLHLHQEALLKLDFIHGAQFLTRLPDDLAADLLFKSIEAIHMNVGKQRFSEVLAHHIDICQNEPS